MNYEISAFVRGSETIWTGERFRDMRAEHEEYDSLDAAVSMFDRMTPDFLAGHGFRGPADVRVVIYRHDPEAEAVTIEREKIVTLA